MFSSFPARLQAHSIQGQCIPSFLSLRQLDGRRSTRRRLKLMSVDLVVFSYLGRSIFSILHSRSSPVAIRVKLLSFESFLFCAYEASMYRMANDGEREVAEETRIYHSSMIKTIKIGFLWGLFRGPHEDGSRGREINQIMRERNV